MAEIVIKTEYLPDQRAGRDAPSITGDGNRLSERTRKYARNAGLAGSAAVVFAWYSAAKSENLKSSGINAPLGPASARFFPSIAAR